MGKKGITLPKARGKRNQMRNCGRGSWEDSVRAEQEQAYTVLGDDAGITYDDAMQKAIRNSPACRDAHLSLSQAERRSEEFNNLYSMNYNFTIMQNNYRFGGRIKPTFIQLISLSEMRLSNISFTNSINASETVSFESNMWQFPESSEWLNERGASFSPLSFNQPLDFKKLTSFW